MNKYIFPKNFYWGCASSATQMEGSANEGGKSENIWDYWAKIDINAFHNQVPPTNTSNFYKEYKEDIQKMKDIGLNSFRTSISWARLIPDISGKVNEEAVIFYNNVINELIANDIEPILGLFHFDMPMYLQELGGWESKEVVELYAKYAKICFELFGDRVKKWVTFNEPIVPVEGGYLFKFHYPLVSDMKRAVNVGYNTILAHAKAVEVFRELNISECKIGIVLNLTPTYTRSDSEEDLNAQKIADAFYNDSFLRPTIKGEFNELLIKTLKEHEVLPVTTKEELDIIKNNTVDFLGVNYYQPRRVMARESAYTGDRFLPEQLFERYTMPNRKMNESRGWEIYEKALYDIAINIRDNYDNIPWYVSENGMGVEGEEKFIVGGMVQDDYRIEFISDHLKWLHKGIEEGSNCFGYHLWTFIDNWSWTNAYKNRYGFVRMDLETGTKTLKKSAYWIKEVISNNAL